MQRLILPRGRRSSRAEHGHLTRAVARNKRTAL